MNVDLSKDEFVKPTSKDGTSPEKGNLMNENEVVIANMINTTKDKSYQSESNTDSTVL